MSHSTKTVYDPVARALHWIMALMMIALLGVGLYMEDLDPSPQKWEIYGLHKSIGMIALFLIGLRILWRLHARPPKPLPTHTPLEQWAAHIVHLALYAAMLAMPVSGYLMSSAGGHAINIFGMLNVPLLVDKNADIGKAAKEIHEIAGNVMIAAIVLHLLGALKHKLIDKDGTLARMMPTRRKV